MFINSQTQKTLVTGITFLLIPMMLFTTNPENLPLPLLMLPFILLFMALYFGSQLVLINLLPNIGRRAVRGVGVALAILPVLLLVLQSISQLTIRDLLITLGLIGLLIFYFRKTDFLV